jgi:polyisoprenoid-binding protein YceI
MMNKLIAISFTALLSMSGALQATEYKIDTAGAHAFIQFKIKHLGYSWLYGRFNDFDGRFNYDPAKPEASSVDVTIKTASLDSNHAERDKHLRGKDFLATDKYPTAKFKSSSFKALSDGKAELKGTLTLHGVSKPVTIAVTEIGGGKDPWGGVRQGFHGTTEITLKDFGINFDLGPASQTVELTLDVEGIAQSMM